MNTIIGTGRKTHMESENSAEKIRRPRILIGDTPPARRSVGSTLMQITPLRYHSIGLHEPKAADEITERLGKLLHRWRAVLAHEARCVDDTSLQGRDEKRDDGDRKISTYQPSALQLDEVLLNLPAAQLIQNSPYCNILAPNDYMHVLRYQLLGISVLRCQTTVPAIRTETTSIAASKAINTIIESVLVRKKAKKYVLIEEGTKTPSPQTKPAK